jgi:hypothetical protein
VVRTLPQLAVTAAVVATLFYVPAGLALLLVLRMFGMPFDSVASFGGLLGTFSGLLAWWLLAFIPSGIYVAWVSRP